jgi:hypothetical protein
MTTIKLPTIEEWACALESGEYKQGRGYLQSGDEFCCLGVHAKLAGIRSTRNYNGRVTFEFPGFGDAYGINPLMKRYGMDHNGKPDLMESVAGMNDRGDAFTEIAATLRTWLAEGIIHDPENLGVVL